MAKFLPVKHKCKVLNTVRKSDKRQGNQLIKEKIIQNYNAMIIKLTFDWAVWLELQL